MEVLNHKKILSEYLDIIHVHSQHPKEDETNVLRSLESLEESHITEDILKETQLGHVISRLVHQERSEKISEKAKQIQLKWVASVNDEKKDIEAGILKRERKEEEVNKPVKRVAVESNNGTPVHKEEVNLDNLTKDINENHSHAQHEHDHHEHEMTRIQDLKFKGTIPENKHRNTNQIRLYEALLVSDTEKEKDEEKVIKVAIDLENCLFEEFGEKEHEYPHHFRSVYLNLKDVLNEQLRDNLLQNKITPLQLVTQSYEDLANPQLKEERKELTKKQSQACYIHEVSPGVINTGEQGVLVGDNITCYSCNSKNISYIPDGSVEIHLVCCSNCGHHWKI